MAVSTQSPAPYTAGAAVINLIRRFRSKGLTAPITGDVLIRAGVSESLVPRTMQSLQILELIDETGNPTPTFLKIRSVPEADYKSTLAEWIHSVYGEVFSFADPSMDDAVRVRDAFRSYIPHGQQDRMVGLFMSLCAEAGIVDPSKKSEPRQPVTKKVVTRSALNKKTPGGRQSAAATPPGPSRELGNFPPALAGLLQSIPLSGGWSKETRDKFLATFGAVLDFVVPLRPDPSVDADGEDE